VAIYMIAFNALSLIIMSPGMPKIVLVASP